MEKKSEDYILEGYAPLTEAADYLGYSYDGFYRSLRLRIRKDGLKIYCFKVGKKRKQIFIKREDLPKLVNRKMP